jgi:hypothetical protein
MTPVALLVCLTVVTNVKHGSVVTNDCHYEMPPVAMVSQPPVVTASQPPVVVVSQPVIPSASIVTPQIADTNVISLAIVEKRVQAKPYKRQFKMIVLNKAKFHHFGIRKTGLIGSLLSKL